MAEGFALGVAIANEFSAIAALINSGGPTTQASPQPPVQSPTLGTSTSTSPVPGVVPPLQSPGGGQLSNPLPLPSTVNVPAINAFGNTPATSAPCPILNVNDYQTLLRLEQQAAQQSGTTPQTGLTPLQQAAALGTTFAIGQYLEINDTFQFSVFSASDTVTVSIYGRMQGLDGQIRSFNYQLKTDGAGTIISTQAVTGPGFLLSAAASIPIGTTLAGNVYALGQIGDIVNGAFTPHTLLFAGQLTATQPLSATPSGGSSAASNPQFFTIPSAGGGVTTKTVTVTPNTGKQVRIISCNAIYNTSAVAGSRGLSVAFQTAGTTRFYSGPGGFMHASEQAQFFCAVNSGQQSYQEHTAGITDSLSCSLPENLYFTQAVGVRMRFDVSFAGDALSNMFVDYEET